MKRAGLVSIFKYTFPQVDPQSAVGMLMFQGFVAGYNKGQDANREKIKPLQNSVTAKTAEIEGLKLHIEMFNQYIKAQGVSDVNARSESDVQPNV
jgi:hypothetical protein